MRLAGWLRVRKQGWNYAIEHAPKGLLKKLDRSVLVTWTVAEDLHRRASESVEKYGILTKAPNTGLPIQSPYLPVVNKQAMIMLKAAELRASARRRGPEFKSSRTLIPTMSIRGTY